MRKFMTSCIDNLTRMSMVLSECSFNQACDYLEHHLNETGEFLGAESVSGNKTKLKFTNHTFYYDENRGYLLQKD